MKSYKNPVTGDSDIEMKKHLTLDDERIQKMLDIKLKVFNKELTPGQARILVNETFDQISAEEFAYGEQHLYNAGITDEIMAEGMDDIIDVFRDVLTVNKLNLPSGHPIQTYADEAAAIQKVVHQMEAKLKGKFIKNEWLELYAKLSQINTHFSRKQHQLFSALERKGFDRPSKIMWTFDDRVRDA
ncbi:MAG TPA: histidine kinase, partial [Bacteroidales bacterium]|nr:histidine kinase [Bacteroidales bacterium]